MDEEEIQKMAKERPYALELLQTQILYDIAGMLEQQGEELINFHQHWQKTIPKGVFEPLTLTITQLPTTLDPKIVESMPWMKFTIYNDGDDAVYIMINEEFIQDRTPLNSGENLTVDMITPQIEKILLLCLPGETCSVRIFARK